MSRNIEIKARVKDIDELLLVIDQFADGAPTYLEQDDTFFHCDQGRLKLRKLNDSNGELIFYKRADLLGPKESFYLLTNTETPDELREILTLAYGMSGRVQKKRVLYFKGRTRIHVDRVTNLGHFLELEVVLGERDDIQIGIDDAHAILNRLGINENQLIDRAYVDLF